MISVFVKYFDLVEKCLSLSATFPSLQTQRSSVEHTKVCPQSTPRIQLQRRPSIRSPLVQERLVTHRPAEAEKGNGRRAGKQPRVQPVLAAMLC